MENPVIQTAAAFVALVSAISLFQWTLKRAPRDGIVMGLLEALSGISLLSFFPAHAMAAGAIWTGSGLATAGYALYRHLAKPKEKPKAEKPEVVEGDTPQAIENDFAAYLRRHLPAFSAEAGDAEARGRSDALAEGGPFPASSDPAPKPGGYEDQIQRQALAAGKRHLKAFLRDLRQKTAQSIEALGRLARQTPEGGYAEQAIQASRNRLHEVRIADLKSAAKEHQSAEARAVRFRQACKLAEDEATDYARRRSMKKTLLVFLLVFLPFEIALSYFMLEDELGKDAFKVAVFAALFIVIFAGAIGYVWQWTKANKDMATRVAAMTAVVLLGTGYLFTLGYAMAYRGDEAQAGNFASMAFQGYQTITGSMALIGIFLLNMAAFLVAVHESAHTFNRYHGWDAINLRMQAAEAAWQGLQDQIRSSTQSAIAEADRLAMQAAAEAGEHEKRIADKQAAWLRIESDAASAFSLVFGSEVERLTRLYREANTEARSSLHGIPAYFSGMPELEFQTEAGQVFGMENGGLPEEEIHLAIKNASAVQEETDAWNRAKGGLRLAMNENENEMIQAALENRRYQIHPDLAPDQSR